MYHCLLLIYKDEIIYGFAVCTYINCADGSKITFSNCFVFFFFFLAVITWLMKRYLSVATLYWNKCKGMIKPLRLHLPAQFIFNLLRTLPYIGTVDVTFWLSWAGKKDYHEGPRGYRLCYCKEKSPGVCTAHERNTPEITVVLLQSVTRMEQWHK